MARRAITTAACAALLLAAPMVRAERPSGTVRSVRGRTVYVDVGRADGLRAGDVLEVRGGPRLHIVHLGEEQAATEPIGGGRVREGARVLGPERPAEAEEAPEEAKRPVKELPPPRALPDEQVETLWAREELKRRPELIAFHEGISRPASGEGPTVAGDVTVLYAGMLDEGPGNLDLHILDGRSRLRVEGLVGGRLDWTHDVSGRMWRGPGLGTRQGADSRFDYRVRRARLRYRTLSWQQERRPAGAMQAVVGRFPVADPAGPGLVDGGAAEVALGSGLAFGVHGGMAPDLLDTAFQARTGVGGGHLRWQTAGDPWWASASVSTVATTWRGSFDRLDVAATGNLAMGGDLDVRAVAVGTLLSDPSPLGRQDFEVTRAFLGVRTRPLDWLTVDAHWAHWQDVPDAETIAAVGLERLTDRPRESGWLQLRFDVAPRVEAVVDGFAGFGTRDAEHVGAAGRVIVRDLAALIPRISGGYRFGRTAASLTQVAHAEVTGALGRHLEASVGYAFSTFLARLLDERLDEHRVDASLYWTLSRALRAQVAASYAEGDAERNLGITALATWRFR